MTTRPKSTKMPDWAKVLKTQLEAFIANPNRETWLAIEEFGQNNCNIDWVPCDGCPWGKLGLEIDCIQSELLEGLTMAELHLGAIDMLTGIEARYSKKPRRSR